MARMTLAGIRNELDTLHRHTGMTITIERTDKDGNTSANGRYINVIVPSGVTQTGIIVTNLGEARDTIRQYLAQTNTIPSTDTFPSDNLTAAIAAHHARYLATIANDPQPEPEPTRAERYQEWANNGGGIDALVTPRDPGPCIGDDDTDLSRVTTPDPEPTPTPAAATTIDIASKYGTFTYQMVAWRCADKGNGGIASYPTWHETLDAHEWLDYRPLTTDRIRRVVTHWPAQNIATVELDNGYWYQVRYETMPAPAPEPYEPGVFGGAHPGDDEETEDAPAFVPAPSPMLAKAIAENRKRQAAKKQRNSPTAAIARAEAAWDAEDAETEAERRIAEMAANVTLTDLRNLHAIHPDHARDHARHIIDTTDVSAPMTPETRPALIARHAQIETARAWLDASPAPEPPAPTPAYATIPAIGGGSHEADTTTKPRNRATSQKRDNQRAQRAALNEAYKAHAAGKASEVSDILTAFGFTIISTKDNDGTPVTIWQDTNPQEIEGTNPDHIAHATIKQTPYSLRIYNGQPSRLPRHGDAELINRMEHGWCACGDARGYAAGLADAILRLIEVPDPLMQALDAMEAREAEQSAPTLDTNPPTDADRAAMQAIDKAMQALRPIESLWSNGAIQPYANDRAAMYRRLQRAITNAEQTMQPHIYAAYMAIYQHDRRDMQILSIANAGDQSPATPPADYVIAAPGHDGRPVIIADVEHHDVSDNLGVLVIRNGRAELVYPERPTIAEAAPDVSDNLPELVLHGGQPSMSGPWELPAISGGNHDADTLTCADCGISSEDTDVQPVGSGDHAPRCWMCRETYAQYMVFYGQRPDDRIPTPCQHDADEPPARFCSQCGHDRSPDAPQPTDTGASHDVTMPSSPDDAARQRMIDADAFIKQAGDARASALHGMLTANAHHYKPLAHAYEAAMMDADAALTAARTIKRVTTSGDAELIPEDFAAVCDALDALRLMGMRPAQSIIDRLLALRVFRSFHERHRTARKFTVTTEERQNNRQAIGAPNITTARRIARNLTGCGITNSATIHEERANNTSILRETWHQAHKLTGDELTAFISPLAFA